MSHFSVSLLNRFTLIHAFRPRIFILPITWQLCKQISICTALLTKGVLKQGEDPKSLTKKDWKSRLTPDQFDVCWNHGTERPFTGEYVNNKEEGVYRCVCCGAELFSSSTKFDSGSGWPSFYDKLEIKDKNGEKTSNIKTKIDTSFGMKRTEVLCDKCGAHLGHVFTDGPPPTGLRYCINSAALMFEKVSTCQIQDDCE